MDVCRESSCDSNQIRRILYAFINPDSPCVDVNVLSAHASLPDPEPWFKFAPPKSFPALKDPEGVSRCLQIIDDDVRKWYSILLESCKQQTNINTVVAAKAVNTWCDFLVHMGEMEKCFRQIWSNQPHTPPQDSKWEMEYESNKTISGKRCRQSVWVVQCAAVTALDALLNSPLFGSTRVMFSLSCHMPTWKPPLAEASRALSNKVCMGQRLAFAPRVCQQPFMQDDPIADIIQSNIEEMKRVLSGDEPSAEPSVEPSALLVDTPTEEPSMFQIDAKNAVANMRPNMLGFSYIVKWGCQPIIMWLRHEIVVKI